MRRTHVILSMLIIFNMLIAGRAFSEDIQVQKPKSAIELSGTIINAKGQPVPNTIITLACNETIREAVTDKDGKFKIKGLSPGLAKITFRAHGYTPLEEEGVQLQDNLDLSRILKQESTGGPWTLLLLLPGLFGLWIAALKERDKPIMDSVKQKEGAAKKEKEGEVKKELEKQAGAKGQVLNQFSLAFLCGVIWVLTLVLLSWFGGLTPQGIYKLHFFDPHLAFEFYVPILGFLGSLLYVLDLFRRGREDISRGKEFGIRLIMGPYVAIVIVVLFGQDLELVDLSSNIGRGSLAFFSGLTVVVALQRLIEKSQESLGRWRQESRHEQSQIAEKFELSQQEDLKLMKAGIYHAVQLRDYEEDALRSDTERVGFDQNLAIYMKNELEKEQLEQAIGSLTWVRFKSKNIKTIEDFAHLAEAALNEIGKEDPNIDVEDLKKLQNKAKQLVMVL